MLMDQAHINKDRVSDTDYEWLQVPAGTGNGAYDPNAHSWNVVTTDHYDTERRFRAHDDPVKGLDQNEGKI